MKKKKLVVFILIGCVFVMLCIFMCACSGKYKVPTAEFIENELSKYYGITLPKNLTVESYASNVSMSDGEQYIVLSCDSVDEEFKSLFTYEDNTEALTKDYFNEEKYQTVRGGTETLEIPDFNNSYGWLYQRSIYYNDPYKKDHCVIVYFYELNKIVVYIMQF